MMGTGTKAGKDVRVVVLERQLPGMKVKLYADRHEGTLALETHYTEDRIQAGWKLLHPVEVAHLEDLFDLLLEARKALTPRRRLDLARMEPPVPVSR